MATDLKRKLKERRRQKIRKKIIGTAEKPRLSVFRSNKGIYAQIIDDSKGITLVGVSSPKKIGAKSEADAEFQDRKGKMALSYGIGKKIGLLAKEKGIETVVFDRGGRLYHGRVKAVAEGARDAGLKF